MTNGRALAVSPLALAAAGGSCADPSPRCKGPLTLDFRHQPTRAHLGFAAAAGSSSLTCEKVATTIRLPSGSVSFPSSGYAASSLDGSSLADTVSVNTVRRSRSATPAASPSDYRSRCDWSRPARSRCGAHGWRRWRPRTSRT